MTLCIECGNDSRIFKNSFFLGTSDFDNSDAYTRSIKHFANDAATNVTDKRELVCSNCGFVVNSVEYIWTWGELYDVLVAHLVDKIRFMGGNCLPSHERDMGMIVNSFLYESRKKKGWYGMRKMIKRDFRYLRKYPLNFAKDVILEKMYNEKVF